MSQELIKALEARRAGMQKSYGNVESSFREVARWIEPARGRFLGQGQNGDRQKAISLIDSTPRQSLRTTRAGLMSGISSPARPWFVLTLPGFEKPSYRAKVWLSEVRRILFEILAGSNAYAALNTCYGDLTLFGAYAGITRFSRDNVIHLQSYAMGSFLWAEDDEGRVDTLHWEMEMPVREVVEKWGLNKCSARTKALFERNHIHQTITVCGAIEPRRTHDPMKPLYATNMPVAVYYWEKGERGGFLHEGGLEAKTSIIGPRWEVVQGDPWPISSPARDALGDVKQLQAQHYDRDIAVQMSYKPPMVGPVEGSMFSYSPGAYNVMAISQMEKGKPSQLVNGAVNVQYLDQGIAQTQERVNEAFYARLFRIASEYGVQGVKDVTAYAISQIKEEQLMVLGPVLDSIDRGLLAPLVETAYHYALTSDLLPPPPDELSGAAVSVQFTGLLFQAMRAIGVAPTERVIGFAGTMAAAGMTSAMQNFDEDKLLRNFADQVGFDADNFRDPDQVEEERKAEAEAMQQQQMIQAAPQMAQAANLISEASARGQEGMVGAL